MGVLERTYAEELVLSAELRGKEIGKELGKELGEKNKQIEIAINLLDILEIETIAMKTGLTIREVEELKSKYNK